MKPFYGLITLLVCVGVSLAEEGLEEKFDDGTVGQKRGKMPWSEMEKEDIHIADGHAGLYQARKDSRAGLLPPLFPGPKYKPGDVLNKVDYASINEALVEVLKAGNLLEMDRIAIGHANEAGPTQNNPRYHLVNGITHSILPPSLAPRRTGLMLFSKSGVSLSGTSGVYTYDIEDTDYKVAVMWNVPANSLLYDRHFNIKVYPKSFATDKQMYKQMFEYAGPWKSGGYEFRREMAVNLTGSMVDSAKSQLAVWSDTSGMDGNNGQPSLHADCSYHALWFGQYCWLECYPSGWCWTKTKCKSAADCVGSLQCKSNC